jgi:hypothetical protein
MASIDTDTSRRRLRVCLAAGAILAAVSTGTAFERGAQAHATAADAVGLSARASDVPPAAGGPGTSREDRSAADTSPPSSGEPERAAEPDAIRLPGSPASSGNGFRWRDAIAQTFFFTSIQTLGRLPNQSTRVNMGGPFVNDWLRSAAGLFDHNWNDGNKIATNYIAHPAGGAVYANIARQNSRYRGLLPGDRGYVKGVMLGMAFAAGASLNHEIGPISEASIGNIGMHNPNQQGWIDPVITTTLGAAWMVMEDVVYRHVLSKIEGRKSRVFWTIVLNPSRSAASAMAGRLPGTTR